MLTTKQERFIHNIVKGMSQREAYKKSYDAKNMSDNSIDREACLLMQKPKVAQRLKELRDELAKDSIMTARERLEYLTGIVKDTNMEKSSIVVNGEIKTVKSPAELITKIRAIDIMNKMQGEYVTKVEADVNSEVNINIELSDE